MIAESRRRAALAFALALVLVALLSLVSTGCDRDRGKPPDYHPDRNGGLWLRDR